MADDASVSMLAEHRGVPRPDMSRQAPAEKAWIWEQAQFPFMGPRSPDRAERHGTALTIAEILAWADAHLMATHAWPTVNSGPVREAPCNLTWLAIDVALREGTGGLPRGSSLPRLLAKHRNVECPPWVGLEQVLAWADAHQAATGLWPNRMSGQVRDAPYQLTWYKIASTLSRGGGDLPPGLSLAAVLAEHRGVKRPLTYEQILAWADAYKETLGVWPTVRSGKVKGGAGDSWSVLDYYLKYGRRGLPGGLSLARLLAQHRGVSHRLRKEPLSVPQILSWADAHHAATGVWPRQTSESVIGVPGESWSGLGQALTAGSRGLPGGSSLAKLLTEHRGVRNRKLPPRLSPEQILAWADEHHAAEGSWPTAASGPISGAPYEYWRKVDSALRVGARGLAPGQSLSRLLAARRTASATPPCSELDRLSGDTQEEAVLASER
jgi:hypothetical protein